MDLRALRHVVTLARILNYSKAAEQLGISQPVLSRSIKSIEYQEGVRFFDRDRSGVRLTPVGKSFVSRAEAVLKEFGELEDSLRSAARGDSGELCFGMAPMPAKVLLAPVVSDLSHSAPELSITAYVRNVDALLTLLDEEKIECFISVEAFLPEPYHLKSSFLGYFPVAPLVRAGHPLVTRFSQEEKYPLLVSAKADDIPYIPLSVKPCISKSGNIVVEDNDVLAQVAENSDGIWMASPYVALDAIEAGRLKAIPLMEDEPRAHTRIVIYSLNRRSLSPAAIRLKEHVRGVIQTLRQRFDASSAR